MPTLAQSINWAQAMLASYIPLTAQTGSEPAITIANGVVMFMQSPPFCWPTNRAEDSTTTTTAGTQDYTVSLTNFGFLERATLKNAANKSWEIPRIYNSAVLGTTQEQTARPESICIKLVTPGTNIAVRMLSAPDATYTLTLTFQKAAVLFTATSQDWLTQCNIPPYYGDIYQNLFLSECFQVNGDGQEAAIYRRRGMAALLAKSEGLSDLQKNMIFAQSMHNDLQSLAATIRAQTAGQARQI
jgi:hypothetical protein